MSIAKRVRVAVVAAAVAIGVPCATALSQRTFVASYGNDANPCSVALPCRGFAAAIAQTSVGGEVIVKDSAGYGTVTITQAVSIIASAGLYAGISLVGAQTGVTINAPAARVLLRNLKINGTHAAGQAGIAFQSAAELTVDHCTISNTGGAGVLVSTPNGKLTMTDTIVRHAVRGVALQSTGRVVLDRVQLLANDGASGYGVWASGTGQLSLVRSVIAGNAARGIWLSSNGFARIDDSLITDNAGEGVRMAGGGGAVSVTRSTVSRNAHGLWSNTTALLGASRNLIAHNGSGIVATGSFSVVTANENTFSRNAVAALDQSTSATLRTILGADSLPGNAGEESTPTSGTVTPFAPF